MPSKGDYQSALANWNKRASQARAAGLPDSSWKPLMMQDLQAVYQQGRTPMADAEVRDAIRSSANLSPIKDPHKNVGSIFDVLGNIPSDVEQIVTGFVPGAVNYVATLPTQMHDALKLAQGNAATWKKYGMDQSVNLFNPEDWGQFLRNAARMPVFAPLVPGLQTAAELTSPAGREQLLEHPVSTAIDVGAAVSMAGKAGLFGSAAAEAADTARTAAETAAETAAKDPNIENVQAAKQAEEAIAPTRTVREAMQAGQPYKAVGRAALKTFETAPVTRKYITRATIKDTLMRLNVHPELVDKLSRPFQQIRDVNLRKMNEFLASDIVKPITDLSEERRGLLERVVNETATEEDKAAFAADPELQTLQSTTRNFMDYMAEMNPKVQSVATPWGKSYYYSKKSPVAKTFTRMTKSQKLLERASQAYSDAAAKRQDFMDRFGPMDPRTQRAVAREGVVGKRLQDLAVARKEAKSEFAKTLYLHAPASFYRTLSGEVRRRAIADVTSRAAQGTLEGQLPDVINHIKGSVDFTDLSNAIGEDEAARLMRDVEHTWTTLAKSGVDPIYLPNTSAHRVEHVAFPTVIPDKPTAPAKVSMMSSFNLSRSVNDVAVGLTEYMRQALTEAGTAEFAKTWVSKWAVDVNQTRNDIQRAILNGGGEMTDALRAQAESELWRNYADWDPAAHGFKSYFPSSKGGTLIMHKGVQRALESLGVQERRDPFKTVYDRGMKVWRFSVLTTPRHLSHILLGGMMFGMLQDPLFIPHFIQHFSEARGIMRGDDYALQAKFGQHINFDPQQLYAIGSGKSHGRIAKALMTPVQKVNRFEEAATQMYKITTMLTKESKGIQREEAIRMANKFFVDMNAMSPFERTTIRQIFPFYGFTRHLFRYLMTYPADHPLAASILTNFANQQEADWTSGLPRDMKFIFQLGSPDANGNVTGIDYRSIDPFRSFYNVFTLGGFFSQANPTVQFIAERAGINVLSGTPELFPHVHYDPNTGQMVADAPPNLLLSAAETLIPEAQVVDAKFKLSDQYRNLAISDPEAFKKRMFTAAGIPFAPTTINVPRKEETTQMKRYRDAQTSIGEAIQSGDFSKAKRYTYVPVPTNLRPYMGPYMIAGQYARPEQIEVIYNALQRQYEAAGYQGSVHAALPKPKRTRTSH